MAFGWLKAPFLGGINPDAEQKRSDDLDARLRKLNQDKLGNGTFTQSVFDESNANIERSRLNVDREIGDAFDEGLQDGASNIRGAVGGTINKVLGTGFSVIPWQVWVALGIYAAIKFGLLKFSKK